MLSAVLSISGVLTSVILTFLLNKILQRSVWQKDYQRYEVDRIVQVFESVIKSIEKRMKIEDELFDELTTRILLTRYLDGDIRGELTNLKKLCINFNKSLIASQYSTSGVSNDEKVSKEELHKYFESTMIKIRKVFTQK